MSKKSGPLTTVEKFYIDNNQDKNVKELAKDLNRNQKIVRDSVNAAVSAAAPMTTVTAFP